MVFHGQEVGETQIQSDFLLFENALWYHNVPSYQEMQEFK